jgi:hypothetical protein
MSENKTISKIFDYLPEYVAIAIVSIGAIAKFVPSLSSYLTPNGIQAAISVIIISILLTLLRINHSLRKIKYDGIPVPSTYTESIGFDWVINGNSNDEKTVIYIGYINSAVENNIISQINSSEIRLTIIININAFSLLPENKRKEIYGTQNSILLSNTPEDTISIFGYSQGECNKITFIRKYINGSGYYSVDHYPYKGFLTEISSAFEKKYLKKGIELTNKSMMNFVSEYQKTRDIFNLHKEKKGKYTIKHRAEFFDKATILVRNADSTIHAIDLTPINNWVTDRVFRDYMEAQKTADAKEKQRIKVISFNEIKNDMPNFNLYVKAMKEAGVDLFFLEKKEFDNLEDYPNAGVLNIDDEVSISFYKPESGAESGKVSFLKSDIEDAEKEFKDLLGRTKTLEEVQDILSNSTNDN